MMNRCLVKLLVLLPATIVLTGCSSLYSDRRNVEMRRRAQIDNMRADIDRMQARVEGLATGQEELFRSMESLQASVNRAQQSETERAAAISREVKATAAAREQLKKEIVDGLSRKMSEIIKTRRPAAARNQHGYEHVVEPGQTISEIAAAYSVKVQAIVDANNLTNPNQIRAGQKLFIPE